MHHSWRHSRHPWHRSRQLTWHGSRHGARHPRHHTRMHHSWVHSWMHSWGHSWGHSRHPWHCCRSSWCSRCSLWEPSLCFPLHLHVSHHDHMLMEVLLEQWMIRWWHMRVLRLSRRGCSGCQIGRDSSGRCSLGNTALSIVVSHLLHMEEVMLLLLRSHHTGIQRLWTWRFRRLLHHCIMLHCRLMLLHSSHRCWRWSTWGCWEVGRCEWHFSWGRHRIASRRHSGVHWIRWVGTRIRSSGG